MKKQIGLFTAILFAVSTLMVSCSQEVHEHTFASEWTSDETNHWHTATCGHTTEVSGKAEHTFGEWTVTKEATEEAEGSRERTCTVCGYKATEAIEKLAHTHTFASEWTSDETYHWYAATCEHTTEVSGKAEHSFGDWTVTKEATKEAEGSKARGCSVCGYTATEVIEKQAHTHKFATAWTKDETNHWHATTCEHAEEVSGKTAHTFGEWTVTKAATCTEKGSRKHTCSVCKYEVTEDISAKGHAYSENWTSDATDHWHTATCEHAEEVSDKTAHTFGEWTVTTAATCTEKGSRKRTCSVCKYEATEDISAKGHAYSEDWTSDATDHWHNCSGCEEVRGKTAHTFGEWTVTKAATCTEKGSRKRTCSVCKYEATEDISAKAHVYSKDWTSNATEHWHAATCGHDVTDSKAAHSFGEWTVTKEATKETKGSKERACTVCNYKDVVDIAKIPEDFVLIPAGTFQMGSHVGYNGNKPVHEVIITKPFYMGKYEVTQAEYEVYCSYGSSSPSSSYGDGDNYPAYYVSWYDALVYCNKRSMAEGLTPCYSISGNTDPSKWGTVPTSSNNTWNAVVCNWNANGYRLPTEAEWEYAARAGDKTVESLTYSGTSDVNQLGYYAWYSDNTNDKTREVGRKLPNAFGLYDMSGNVYEWCWNWYTSSYNAETEGGSDPTGTSAGSSRIFRGGSCGTDSDCCAVSFRNSRSPYFRLNFIGFRVVRASSK